MKLRNLYFLYYWTVMLSCCFVPVTRKNVPFYTFLMTIICDHINYLVVHKNCKYLYIDRYTSLFPMKHLNDVQNILTRYWNTGIKISKVGYSIAECIFLSQKCVHFEKISCIRNVACKIGIDTYLYTLFYTWFLQGKIYFYDNLLKQNCTKVLDVTQMI